MQTRRLANMRRHFQHASQSNPTAEVGLDQHDYLELHSASLHLADWLQCILKQQQKWQVVPLVCQAQSSQQDPLAWNCRACVPLHSDPPQSTQQAQQTDASPRAFLVIEVGVGPGVRRGPGAEVTCCVSSQAGLPQPVHSHVQRSINQSTTFLVPRAQ